MLDPNRAPLVPLPVPPPRDPDALTARELEVTVLIVAGHSNKIIADKLTISDHTAKFHVRNVCRKFNTTSRVIVAAEAVRRGIA